jgi:hypothetical protein
MKRVPIDFTAMTLPVRSTWAISCHSSVHSPFPAYFIDSLPDIPFDIGEMYSGLIPIDKNNASRALFFVFQPTVGEPVDEVTIWLNGGPGECI